MVKLAGERNTATRIIDTGWYFITTLIYAILLFIITLFGLRKESNRYSKSELKYLIDESILLFILDTRLTKKKKNDSDDDDDDDWDSKPKIIRGLGGNADCKS